MFLKLNFAVVSFVLCAWSFNKLLLTKEELEQKHVHLLQVVESEKTAKWQYTQQCEELASEIRKLRAEVGKAYIDIIKGLLILSLGGNWNLGTCSRFVYCGRKQQDPHSRLLRSEEEALVQHHQMMHMLITITFH